MIEAAVIAIALAAPPTDPGPWKRHTIDDSSRGADGVRIADANGDGLMDIATGWEEGGVVRVYLNPGRDTSKHKWPAVTVGKVKNVEDAVFVDLDNDGALDVVSSCEGGTRTMYVHWAPKDPAKYLDESAWTTEPIPATVKKQQWMYCLPMQVDDRRGVDLVVGSKNKNAAVGWLESPEDPRELDKWTYHKIIDAGWIMSLQRVRLTDARSGFVYSDRRGDDQGVYSLETRRERDEVVFAQRRLVLEKFEAMFLDVIDGELPVPSGELTRHGDQIDLRPRLIVAAASRDSRVRLVVNAYTDQDDEIATAIAPTLLANPFDVPHGKAVAFADIDGDGTIDLVHSSNTEGDRSRPGVAWISGKKGDTRHRNISGPQGAKFDRIELVDLDGDGDLDVITCEERDNLGVIWYENPTK